MMHFAVKCMQIAASVWLKAGGRFLCITVQPTSLYSAELNTGYLLSDY